MLQKISLDICDAKDRGFDIPEVSHVSRVDYVNGNVQFKVC